MLRILPGLTIALFLGPVAAGLLGTLLPSLGYLPALGGERLSLEPWRQLFDAPGLATALRLSLVSGFVSTALALALTILVFAAGHGTRTLTRAKQSMTPLLAVPHLAMAVGLAFLIAPSGWLARLASPWLTGWDRPPDLALVQDPHGLALTLGLVIKETPFLILMTFAALGQIRADDQLRMARSLGYGPVCAWLKVVLPRVYPQIRLPVYAVLAYCALGGRHGDRARARPRRRRSPCWCCAGSTIPTLRCAFRPPRAPACSSRSCSRRSASGAASRPLLARLARPWLVGGRRGGSGRAATVAAWIGIAAAVRPGARQRAQPRRLVGRGIAGGSPMPGRRRSRSMAGRSGCTSWRSPP